MLAKVTIVIPFYNCNYVGQAVHSALKQSYPNKEVLVVDDGSDKRYFKELQPFMGEITYMQKKNGGTASALNLGIEKASGNYITWLSSDDLYAPEKVEKQVSFMQKHGALFSFSNYCLINETNEVIANVVGPRYRTVIEFYRDFLKGNTINGCTVMMHKQIFNDVGLFDEALPFTHDYDLWLRIMLARHDLYYLDEALTMYRYHPEMGTRKYGDMIAKEIEITQCKYQLRLSKLIDQIIGGE